MVAITGRCARLACLGALILAGAGCQAAPSPATASPPMPSPRAIETADDLAAALEQAVGGAAWDGPAPDRFGVPGQNLAFGGDSVDVYTFTDGAARATAQSEIGPDGRTFQGQPLPDQGRPRIWGAGRLLVVYDGDSGETFVVLSGLLGDPVGVQPAENDEPYPPAVAAAVGALAQALGVSPARVQVMDFQPMTWTDSCLGLGTAEEACAAGEVPGWQVDLRSGNQSYEVRTDGLGQLVRWAGQ